jgi:phage/plasmid-associated DNA primase
MKGGPNPQVANLMYKRGVITREPDDSAGFCLSTIKELTGGSKINARLCNSNDTDIRICMTLIDESNKKPFIRGRIDNSAVRRIIDIPFRSIFVSKEEVNEYQGDNIKEGNKNLTTDIFREKYKLPLFEILKDYAKKLIENGFDTDKYKPKSIKERTMEYLQDSDRFLTYFTEEYERDNDKKSFIELSETYNRFKNSEFYNSLSRKDKIQWTKKYYIQNIKENILLRKDFCERHFYIDEQKQKQQPRNVLLSWKKKLIN